MSSALQVSAASAVILSRSLGAWACASSAEVTTRIVAIAATISPTRTRRLLPGAGFTLGRGNIGVARASVNLRPMSSNRHAAHHAMASSAPMIWIANGDEDEAILYFLRCPSTFHPFLEPELVYAAE